MNGIGWAVKQLKDGAKVRRAGWNGVWLAYSPGAMHGLDAKHFWSPANRVYANAQPDGVAKVLPCITMKTATGEILMGWLASQTDLLATDWELA